MANDPYWNSTSLLLHGDTPGDPNYGSMVMGISGAKPSAEAGTIWLGAGAIPAVVGGRPCFDLSNSSDGTTFVGAYGAQTAVFDGDFTLEWWFYQTGDATYNTYGGAMIGATSSYAACSLYYLSSNGSHTLSIKNGGFSFTFTPTKNQWNHHAIVVSGGVASYYVGGVRRGVGATGATNGPTVNGFRFGYTPSLSNSGIPGYISGVRFYKGVAKYSGASLTVPAWPDIPYSSLFDSSPNPKGFSANGSALAIYTPEFKYGGGCMRFDGSSYAETPASAEFNFGTGDFTVEAWVYRQASGVWQALVSQWNNTTDLAWSMHINTYDRLCFFTKNASFDYYGDSGQLAIPLNQWAHCAVSHKGGVRRVFVNGKCVGAVTGMAAIATGSSTTVLRLGRAVAVVDPFTGLLDDVRVTKGVARYDVPTPAQLAFTPPVAMDFSSADPYWGTVALAMDMEQSPPIDAKGTVLTISGSPVRSAVQAKHGTYSLRFDGTAGYIDTIPAANCNFGSDFTIECWFFAGVQTSNAWGACPIWDQSSNASNGEQFCGVTTDGQHMYFVQNNTSRSIATVTMQSDAFAPNQWHHYALSCTNGVLRMFIDGQTNGDVRYNFSWYQKALPFKLGAMVLPVASYYYYFNGYIDDFRITRGVGRYFAAFTPPAQSHPEGLTTVSGTVTDVSGALCSRMVHVHSRATGRLLGTAVSDPVTGVYSIGAAEPCYAVVLDATGDYDALVLDRLDPVT